MNAYLDKVMEWAARFILARAVVRASELLEEWEAEQEDAPRSLPPVRLPQIEYRQ